MKLKTIFHRTPRPTKEELDSLVAYYNGLTAELPNEWALEHLNSPDQCHWLMLMKIQAGRKMGGLYAILTAFRLGFLYGQGKLELGGTEQYGDETYWAQEYRERTSEILTELEDVDALARIYYLAKKEAGQRHE